MTVEFYKFKPFDDASITATRAHWKADADKGLAFPTEVERLLDWADSNRDPTHSNGAAFGLFRDGKKVALGLCEVVVTRQSTRSKWVKMLRLHLSPEADAALQAGNPELAMNVFVSSILGSMTLQSEHKASTLKVFGRTQEQLTFLRSLVTHLQAALAKKGENGVKASIEGRFLSIVHAQRQEKP